MEITEVRVFPVNEDKLKAYATITFDDCFVVRDLKVIHGNSGLFVAMPSKKRKDGTFKDVAHPLNNEFRSKIEQKVLDAYEGERAAAVGAHPTQETPPPPSSETPPDEKAEEGPPPESEPPSSETPTDTKAEEGPPPESEPPDSEGSGS